MIEIYLSSYDEQYVERPQGVRGPTRANRHLPARNRRGVTSAELVTFHWIHVTFPILIYAIFAPALHSFLMTGSTAAAKSTPSSCAGITGIIAFDNRRQWLKIYWIKMEHGRQQGVEFLHFETVSQGYSSLMAGIPTNIVTVAYRPLKKIE